MPKSPDGTGGMNINDGYDFTSMSQFDIGSAEHLGPVNLSNLAGQVEAVNYATGGSKARERPGLEIIKINQDNPFKLIFQHINYREFVDKCYREGNL